MDYSNLREVVVKTQEELDAIPEDFKGEIYIQGDEFTTIFIKKRYYFSVEARGNSSVEAWGNSSVVARGNSSVVAWGNSSVEARENSSVVARENSSVEAWGNSSVVAWGNVQVVDFLQGAKIKISGNARIVYNPKSTLEFLEFYGIKHTKIKAKLFKAVHKSGDTYLSDYDSSFTYQIGEKYKVNCDPDDKKLCSYGIHLASLGWTLGFGADWKDLAILEVETKIEDVVVPVGTDGKVRTKEIKVLREVPLEDCGLYGKFLAKRRGRYENPI